MTKARLYIVPAANGKSAEMETALVGLSKIVDAADGYEGVEVLHDIGIEHRFILSEKWASEEHHATSLVALAKDALAPVLAAGGGPPDGAYYNYLVR